MSNSIKKLLKGKGLLAELEGCRNEEEAIDVLKRENLWGIINYPELEELKESYENGEIEADGTLSLSQLDKVAGGNKKVVRSKEDSSFQKKNKKKIPRLVATMDLAISKQNIEHATGEGDTELKQAWKESLEEDNIKVEETKEEKIEPVVEDGNSSESSVPEDKSKQNEEPIKQGERSSEEAEGMQEPVDETSVENEVESVKKTEETDYEEENADVDTNISSEPKKQIDNSQPLIKGKSDNDSDSDTSSDSEGNVEHKEEVYAEKEKHEENEKEETVSGFNTIEEGEKTKNDYNDLFDFEEALITITDEDLESMLGDMGEEVALDKTANEETIAESKNEYSYFDEIFMKEERSYFEEIGKDEQEKPKIVNYGGKLYVYWPIGYKDVSEICFNQLVPKEKQKSFDNDLNEIIENIGKVGENWKSTAKSTIEDEQKKHIKEWNDRLDGFRCKVEEIFLFNKERREQGEQGEFVKFYNDTVEKYECLIKEYTERVDAEIENTNNYIQETCETKITLVKTNIIDCVSTWDNLLLTKIDPEHYRIIKPKTGGILLRMSVLEYEMYKENINKTLTDCCEGVKRLYYDFKKDISREMGSATTSVKQFESDRFEEYSKMITDEVESQAALWLENYNRLKMSELTGNREEVVDLSVSLQKLNESIGNSINLAECYRSKDMYREAAIEYKKVACAYCDSRNPELTIYYAIEASRLFNLIGDTTNASGCLALVAYIYSPKNWKEIDRELQKMEATEEETSIIYTIICDKHKYLKDIVDFGLTCIEGREDINGDMFCEVAIVCDRLGETELAMKCICLALRKYRDENEKEKCYERVAAMYSKEYYAKLEEYNKFKEYDSHIMQIFNKEEIFCIYNNLIQKRPFAKSIILNSDDAKREEIISSSLPEREDELLEVAHLAYRTGRRSLAMQCAIALVRVFENEKKKDKYINFIASMHSKKGDENYYFELAKIASEIEFLDIAYHIHHHNTIEDALMFRFVPVWHNAEYGDMLLDMAYLFKALGNKESSMACAFQASIAYQQENKKLHCCSFIVNVWETHTPGWTMDKLRECMNEINMSGLPREHPLICLIYENIENVAKDYSDRGENIQSGKKYVELMCDLVEHYYNELEQTIRYGLCALEQFQKIYKVNMEPYDECCSYIAHYIKKSMHRGEISFFDFEELLKRLGAGEKVSEDIINTSLALEYAELL